VGLLWIRKRERTTFAQWRRGVGIVMSSPIPTRNRASITLPSPCFMFDDVEENKHKSEDLFGCLRRPLLKALHVSTSSRRPFFSPASLELELVEIDFWEWEAETNGPHYNTSILAPAAWSNNLLLCVVAKSIMERHVISLHMTDLDGSIIAKQKTINNIHHLFKVSLKDLHEQMMDSSDLNHAYGGRLK
jgi:hypothetical protein